MMILSQALRRLRRERGYTTAAVATLSLGIGATLAVFALVEAVLLNGLPYPNADRIVMLRHHDTRTGIEKNYVALGDVVDIAARSRSFDAIGAYDQGESQLRVADGPIAVPTLRVTHAVFEILDLRPLHGRRFTAEDSREGGPQVAILGHQLWQEQFRGDPDVVGRSIRVGNEDLTVVGIAPAGWRFPPTADTQLILSEPFPTQAPAERRQWTLAMGRLRPNVTVGQAEADVAAIAVALEREYPAENAATRYRTLSLRDALVGDTRQALLLLLAASIAVLLIAVSNVANLVLVRTLAREREFAVQRALGAGFSHLARPVAAEALLIALMGATIGLVVAILSARGLVALVPATLNVPGLDSVSLNPTVAGAALGLAVFVMIAVSILSIARVRHADPARALQSGLRSSGGQNAQRKAGVIVGGQIAFAVTLLFGAGLAISSFSKLVSVSPGFESEHVRRLSFNLPAERYDSSDARRAFFAELDRRLSATPGVEATGIAAITPLTGNNWTHPLIRPDAPVPAGERPPEVGWQVASGGYFRALNIPLVAGRFFDATDHPESEPVVIVSDALAKKYFPDGAVGRLVLQAQQTARIVGVVGSIRRAALTDEPRVDMYLPAERALPGGGTLFVRTVGDPSSVERAVRGVMREIEPLALVSIESSLEEVRLSSVAIPRLLLALLTGFGGIALLLASVGVYGVASYAVQRQSRDIGTRIALGATRGSVYRMVMRWSLGIAASGAVIGLALALGTSRLLGAFLYSTSPFDPAIAIGVVVLLLLVSALATALPARRAAITDPARTLTG